MMKPLMAFLLLTVSAHAAAEPFHSGDQNPLLTGYGIPRVLPARIAPHSMESRATLNWSNTAAIQNAGNESLVMDLESREWHFTVDASITSNLALRAELPYRTYNGGSLDGFIENWHSFFGFPKGDRPVLPRHDVRVEYRRNGNTRLQLLEPQSSFADATLSLGYQFHASTAAASAVWFAVKLPTGSSDRLTGSGAMDFAATATHEYSLSSRWLARAQFNASYLGRGDVLSEMQTRSVVSGLLAFEYSYSNHLSLSLQLDGHQAVFKDSALPLLGNAWIVTVGGEYSIGKHWYAQLGVSEDVKVDASPDVNFTLSLARR